MLDPGSVSVDDAGSATGTGLAFALYTAMVTQVIDPFASQFDASTIVTAKKSLATSFANPVSAGMLPYFTDNGDVRIKSTDDKLQRLPTPPIAGADTDGPSADRVLVGALE